MKSSAARFTPGARRHPYHQESQLTARETDAIRSVEIPVAVVYPQVALSDAQPDSPTTSTTALASSSPPDTTDRISPTLVNSVEQGTIFLDPLDEAWYSNEYSPTAGSIVIERIENFTPPPPPPAMEYAFHHTITAQRENVEILAHIQDVIETHLSPVHARLTEMYDRQIQILQLLEQITRNSNRR
jgi:hypothetical protein